MGKSTTHKASAISLHHQPPSNRLLILRKSRRSTTHIRLLRRNKSRLLELPTELMLKIIGMIPLWHHNRMRGVCRQLRTLTDLNVMHQVQRRLAGNMASSSYEVAVQEAMIQLTWAFRSASFYDIFPGALLSLLRQNPDRPFSPSRNTFNDFIRLWFDHMYGTITTNRFRYAYVITLLGFLNRNEIAEKEPDSEKNSSENIHLTYRLPNSWLGILHAAYPAPKSLQFPQDGAFLLIFLCNVLILSLTGQVARKIVEGEDKVYYYGKTSPGRHRCTFQLRISCDADTISELRESVRTRQWNSKKRISYDDLSVSLLIESPESYKMGCSWKDTIDI